MTTRQFYLRALAVPVAVPLLAAAGFALMWVAASHADPISEFQWSGWLFGIAFIGAWSTIPYLLFVIGYLLWMRKPRSDRALRLVPWIAPLIIAVPFALWAASFDLRRLEWSNAWGIVILYGGAALVVGYAYVLPIQLTFLVLKWRRAISA